jgi:NADPH:quinone reductase-like Zn-dependent oxidoreductase
VIGTASPANIEFVRSLGAERVIDYTTTLFEEVVQDVDLVLDTIGGETQRRSVGVVKPGGTLVSLLEPPPQELVQERGIRAFKNTVTPNNEHLQMIAGLIVEGQVRAVAGRRFSLLEVRQAHELSQTGHGQGRIVLEIRPG